MIIRTRAFLHCTSLLALVLTALPARSSVPGYLLDSYGNVARNNYGECWRTSSWTPDKAIPGCKGYVPPPAPKPPAKADITPPPPPPAPEPAQPQAIGMVNFDFDRSAIKPEAAAKLDEMVTQLRLDDGKGTVVLRGYTDAIGTETYNQGLGLRRAEAVKTYLVGKGIPEDRIRIQSFGEQDPIRKNSTEEGRAMNRRVEIEIEFR